MDKEIRPEDLSLYYNEMLRSNLLELEVETPKGKLILRRLNPNREAPLPVASQPLVRRKRADNPASAAKAAESALPTVKSPITGVFYRSASPQSAPFVKEGDSVHLGSVLCIVEAMKVMNEIKADGRFRVVRIMVENAKPITKGQPLFQVEPL